MAKAIINDELYPDASESEIVYEAISELPEGLNVSSDGTVSGTPQETSNSFGFTVKATYMDYSLTASFVISIIDSGGSIVYSAENTDLGVAMIGTAWSVSVAYAEVVIPDATDDQLANLPAITYSLKDGSLLPDGLTLSSAGEITGTPTKECENYSFTVLASALGYTDAELTFTIDVFNAITFEGGEPSPTVSTIRHTPRKWVRRRPPTTLRSLSRPWQRTSHGTDADGGRIYNGTSDAGRDRPRVHRRRFRSVRGVRGDRADDHDRSGVQRLLACGRQERHGVQRRVAQAQARAASPIR